MCQQMGRRVPSLSQVVVVACHDARFRKAARPPLDSGATKVAAAANPNYAFPLVKTLRRTVFSRGFSIAEALIAMGLVVLALIGLFGLTPYTYHALQDDSLRIEAATAAQRYMDDVRLAVQSGMAVPGPIISTLETGNSFTTDQHNESTATVELAAACQQVDGPTSLLFDCTVSIVLDAQGEQHTLPPLESFIARQLP